MDPLRLAEVSSSGSESSRLKDQPSEEYSYRIIPPSQSTKHLLRAEDEMQLADNLAFLAQWQEGVENVTASTLQEKTNGLLILLASNHTLLEAMIHELRAMLALVSENAFRGNFLGGKVDAQVAYSCREKK